MGNYIPWNHQEAAAVNHSNMNMKITYTIIRAEDKISSIDCSPDGRSIIYSDRDGIHIFDHSQQTQIGKFQSKDRNYPFNSKYSPDGRVIASLGFHTYTTDLEFINAKKIETDLRKCFKASLLENFQDIKVELVRSNTRKMEFNWLWEPTRELQ